MAKSGKKTGKIILVVIIILILSGIGVGTYFAISKSNEKTKDKDRKNETVVQDDDQSSDQNQITENDEQEGVSNNQNDGSTQNHAENTTSAQSEDSSQGSLHTDNDMKNSRYEFEFSDSYFYVYDEAKFSGDCEILTMSGDNYSELVTAVNEWSEEYVATYESRKEEYTEKSKEVPENEMHYYLYQDLKVMRADDTIFSLMIDENYYCGGQMEVYEEHGVTFDAKTGKQLKLSDLGDIEDELKEYLVNFVDSNNLEASTGEDFENDLSALMDTTDGLTWMLTGDGIYVYYPCSYEQGELSFIVPYNKLSGFNEAYLPDDESFTLISRYGSSVDDIEEFGYYTDINSDGANELLKLELVFDEYWYGIGVNVHVGDEVFEINDLYFYSASFYLVRAGESEVYLLFTTGADNDYKTTYQYKLTMNGVEHVDTLISTNVEYIFFDDIETHTKIDRLGTFSASRTYKLSADGLTPVDERFDLNNDEDASFRRWVETKQVVSVKLMQDDELVDKELPIGTILYPANTDNTSVLGFYLEDGTYGELYYEVSPEGFGITIDGVDEYELFDNLLYAG